MTASATAYRTHLFSDLRGYTRLMERAGNAAGAEMLSRYRALVRSAIERHGGTEVSTEGDAFYVVFQSASSAVMCALAMVDEAALENTEHPDVPIRIGVGIHTGEVVETEKTFIGTAVNVASRVCAVARPGEVLVTATVRGITHGSVAASFVSRGKKRLKGLAEPVELFTVLPAGRSLPALQRVGQGRAALAALVAVVGALAIGLVAALAFWLRPSAPAATQAPTQVPSAVVGPLPIGTYQTARLSPTLHFVITDLGWSTYRDTSDAVGLRYEFEPPGQLDIGRPGRVFTDPCSSGGASVPTGRSSAEFFAAARQAGFLHVQDPTAASIGGQGGLRSDITIDPGSQAACGGLGGSGVAVFSLGGEFWSAQPGEIVRVVALDTKEGLIAVLASSEKASATSVEALENFFNLVDRVVQSITF
jgi:class 3 adenylate cyclase